LDDTFTLFWVAVGLNSRAPMHCLFFKKIFDLLVLVEPRYVDVRGIGDSVNVNIVSNVSELND
jgi:hypothetical protein|tara:strand:- start:158 stop:346 length:189 start_codon:yes stop_codon:yes gene_type:complete